MDSPILSRMDGCIAFIDHKGMFHPASLQDFCRAAKVRLSSSSMKDWRRYAIMNLGFVLFDEKEGNCTYFVNFGAASEEAIKGLLSAVSERIEGAHQIVFRHQGGWDSFAFGNGIQAGTFIESVSTMNSARIGYTSIVENVDPVTA